MVSNVRDSAYALLVAALNPESDPSWDEEIELSIVLCSDDHIQALNRQWRGKDAPTDVLSFVQDSSDSGKRAKPRAAHRIADLDGARAAAFARI
eukprot:796304-Rhodomonas_salina.3